MKEVLSYVLNAILIVVLIFAVYTCGGHKQGKKDLKEVFEQEMSDAQKQMDYAWAKYDSCLAAKMKADTIYDTIYKPSGYVYINKDLTLEDSLEIHNIFAVSTTGETIELKKDSVGDVWVTEDFAAPWEVVFTGQFHELRFPSYQLFEEKIVERYVINNPPPPIDPVIEREHRSALFLHAEFGNNLQGGFDWNSAGGGITWIHKRGAMIGFEYEWLSIPDNLGNDVKDQLLNIRVGYRITK